MARTRQTARKAATPPPIGPRVSRTDNLTVREDLPTKVVERIVIVHETMRIYWENEVLFLEWKQLAAEELYPYWADSLTLHELDDEEISLLCSKMTDLNVYKDLHILYCTEMGTKMLLDCFRPPSVIIWIREEYDKDFLRCEELKCSKSISFLSYDNETVFGLELLVTRSDLETLSIDATTNIVWQCDLLKLAIQNWIIRENAFKSISLTFPETITSEVFERDTLDGLDYEIIWKYNDHATSLLKNIDIERFKEYKEHEAVVLGFTRTGSDERALVCVIDNVFTFGVLRKEDDLAVVVDENLYNYAVRWITP